jgi:hypothetical protein
MLNLQLARTYHESALLLPFDGPPNAVEDVQPRIMEELDVHIRVKDIPEMADIIPWDPDTLLPRRR